MQIKRKQWHGHLIVGIAALVLMAGCTSSPQATATVPTATATPDLLGLQCIHESGRNDLCYTEGAIAEDAALLEKAVKTFCTQSEKYWCFIYVWKDKANVADALPLTDAESAALLAKYIYNPNTGEDCLQVFDKGVVVQSLGFCN